MKIKKNDNVMIISGKDRGKTGLVEKVLVKADKVLVTGVALAKHHLKPTRQNPQGGIATMPAPIAASNVMLVCPHCGKPVRVAHRVSATSKERVCRKCQGNLDAKVQVKTKDKPATKAVAKANPSTKLGVKENNA